jgi:type II secretory pathway pseudopilin PulG
MNANGPDREFEMKLLLQQYSQRQIAMNQQVLQAIQQATAALRQAQQLLTADIQFHQTRNDTEGYLNFQPTENDSQLPPWLRGRPPELQ